MLGGVLDYNSKGFLLCSLGKHFLCGRTKTAKLVNSIILGTGSRDSQIGSVGAWAFLLLGPYLDSWTNILCLLGTQCLIKVFYFKCALYPRSLHLILIKFWLQVGISTIPRTGHFNSICLVVLGGMLLTIQEPEVILSTRRHKLVIWLKQIFPWWFS